MGVECDECGEECADDYVEYLLDGWIGWFGGVVVLGMRDCLRGVCFSLG